MRLDAGLVTPLAGVWIEIKRGYHSRGICSVTPLAGVWIEIPCMWITMHCPVLSLPLRECGLKSCSLPDWCISPSSLPLRECGLKYVGLGLSDCIPLVTPLAGVWIEMGK